ncbi:MAG TPA: MFS transporter [Solirubrobacteraceae bacterium]|nr:MFS transporter [Solirubrobacteraceae bacterium]
MKKVLGLPAFRRLLAVSMMTELALSVGTVALAVLVYRRTGSAFGAVAFFLCAEFGPALVSPLFVSRFDGRAERIVLANIYVAEALIFALLAWIIGRFSLVAVLALVLVDGTLAVTARVLVRAAWTASTSRVGLMPEASAVVNAGYSVCFMVGPALGGAIVAAAGTRAALLVNVAAFGISALTVATSPSIRRPSVDGHFMEGRLRAAFAYARAETVIRRLLSLQAVAMLFFTISIPVEVVFAQRTLHAGPGGYGVLLAVWGAGTIIGSGIYVRWRRLPYRVMVTVGTCLLGSGFLVMAVAPNLAVALVGAAIGGAGNGSQIVAVKTALQEAVQQRWLALVLSLNESMLQAVPGLGIVVGGAITALAGTRIALAAGAAGSLAAATLMWSRLPRRIQSTAAGREAVDSSAASADQAVTASSAGLT